MTDLNELAEYEDFHALAKENLPKPIYDHLAAGAMTNWTRDENRRAYDRWVFDKRLMRNVSDPDLSTSVMGTELDLPVMLAPSAFHRMVHPEGELATAKAAKAAGSAICLSTLSSTPLEEVAATGVDLWLQIQIHKDRGLTTGLMQRAEQAGFKGFALTVDAPNYGIRPADKRNHIHLPTGVRIANLEDRLDLPHHARGHDLMAYLWSEMELDATWEKDGAWFCEQTDLPVIAKGVMGPAEARSAIESGCAAVLVSNQGGRQLDGDPATIDVLPAVVDEVGAETEVMVDGGIRNGAHVLKALALGARAVMVGRPIYWSLAVAGADGLEQMLAIFREDLINVMQMAGVRDVKQIPREIVTRPPVPFSLPTDQPSGA